MEIQLSDIHSLSDFQRNTKEHLREMERSGHPRVLTVNGKAKVVVQDARSYQKLLAQLEEAETVLTLRRRLASMQRGKKGRPLVDVLGELGERGTRSRTKKRPFASSSIPMPSENSAQPTPGLKSNHRPRRNAGGKAC